MLSEQDLTDLEMADAAGDFGRDSKVSEAVEELRALRALRDGLLAIRLRVARLTIVSGLPDAVWSELCHLESDMEQAVRVAKGTP